jgi:hypothetical protein
MQQVVHAEMQRRRPVLLAELLAARLPQSPATCPERVTITTNASAASSSLASAASAAAAAIPAQPTWGTLHIREADEVSDRQRAAEPFLDAGETKIVIPAQTELTAPDCGAEHAVVASLDDVHTAVVAAMPGDFFLCQLVLQWPCHG